MLSIYHSLWSITFTHRFHGLCFLFNFMLSNTLPNLVAMFDIHDYIGESA